MSNRIAEYYDVIVVGGGPAGSVTARFIAEGGYSVLILERDREVGIPVRCAEGVSHHGIEHFIDINAKWINTTIEGARLYAPDGSHADMYNNGIGYIVDRRVFDRELVDIAVSHGAQILTKADAIGLLYSDNKQISGVRFTYDNSVKEVRCKIVIGADGIESKVGRWAGIDTSLKLNDVCTCCQYTINNNIQIDKSLIHVYFGTDIAPGGYLWLFPKSETSANIGVGISGELSKPGKGPKYYLDKFISQHFPKASLSYSVFGGVPTLVGEEFITDGVMLVGDAARQANPITGGGIAQGMIAGKFCGETAVKALKSNNTSTKFLNEYKVRWFDHIGANQRFMYSLKKKFIKWGDDRFNNICAIVTKIPRDEFSLKRLFQESLKEDPIMLASLATSFVVSKLKK